MGLVEFFAASWGLVGQRAGNRGRLVQIKPQNHFRTTFDQHGIQSRVSVCSAKRASNDQAFNRQRPLKGVPKARPSPYYMIYLRARSISGHQAKSLIAQVVLPA
jgi:hypothetical protein